MEMEKCREKKPASGRGALDDSDVSQLLLLWCQHNRLGKSSKMNWPAAVAGAQGQGQGKGASGTRSSKVQLEHGIMSGTTSPARLCFSLPHWSNPLPHISSMHKSNTNTQATLACLHTSTYACTPTCTCLQGLVQLCYWHKNLPRQAVTRMLMPATSVGNPSRCMAAKMEVQGCRKDGVHGHLALTGSTSMPIIAQYLILDRGLADSLGKGGTLVTRVCHPFG